MDRTTRFTPEFNYRKPYFDGVGNKITGKVTYEEALKLGCIDYEVEKRPITTVAADGNTVIKIPDKFATVRTDREQVLGVVGSDYTVIQNRDSFAFVEDLLGSGIGVEAAGNYGTDGNKCFILAQGEPLEILGDEVSNHIFISNSFDGGSSIRAMFTPVRLVCANGLVIIDEKRANVRFTIGHYKNAKQRLITVHQLLTKNLQYMHLVKRYAEYLASIQFSEEEFDELCDRLVPAPADESKDTYLKMRNREEKKRELKRLYKADDLANFRGSAYKAIMAISDYESHGKPAQQRAKTVDEYHLRQTINGMQLLNTAVQIINGQYGYRAKVSL